MSNRTLLDKIIGRRPLYGEEGKIFASFNDRLFANIIDLILIYILLAPLLQIFNDTIYGGVHPLEQLSVVQQTAQQDQQAASHLFSTLLSQWLTVNIIQLTLLAIPYIILWNYFQATPGKMLLGLKIVDAKTLEPAHRKTYIKRYVWLLLSIPPFMLGFIWLIFSKRKQAWHDRLSGTVVVHGDYSYLVLIIRGWNWLKRKIKAKLGIKETIETPVDTNTQADEKSTEKENVSSAADPLEKYKK